MRITYVGAAFLAIIAIIPNIVSSRVERAVPGGQLLRRDRPADRHQRGPGPGAEDQQPPGHAELSRPDRRLRRGFHACGERVRAALPLAILFRPFGASDRPPRGLQPRRGEIISPGATPLVTRARAKAPRPSKRGIAPRPPAPLFTDSGTCGHTKHAADEHSTTAGTEVGPRDRADARGRQARRQGAADICREWPSPAPGRSRSTSAVDDVLRRTRRHPALQGLPRPGGRTVPFPAVTCLRVNEQVVHGIPGPRPLKDGDMLKVDTACKLNGWCADRAVTHPDRHRAAGADAAASGWPRRCCRSPSTRCAGGGGGARSPAGCRSTPRRAASAWCERTSATASAGSMHENPQVPNSSARNCGSADFRLEPGLVLAVEPMVNMGRSEVDTLGDHWTVVTQDGLPSVHVEHTLAITARGSSW